MYAHQIKIGQRVYVSDGITYGRYAYVVGIKTDHEYIMSDMPFVKVYLNETPNKKTADKTTFCMPADSKRLTFLEKQ